MMCLKKQHSKRYTQEQLDTLTASGIHIDTRRRYFLIIHVLANNTSNIHTRTNVSLEQNTTTSCTHTEAIYSKETTDLEIAQTMWIHTPFTHMLAQWKPGDLFVFRSMVNLPEIRCYREIPTIGGPEGHINRPTVNLGYVFLATAVYEENTFTAVRFQNMDARIPLADPGQPHHAIGPAESYWTVVRHNHHLLCRHIRRDYQHYLTGEMRPRTGSR